MIKLLYLNHDIAFPSSVFARAGDGAVIALGTLWQDHASERATPPLFIISHSCLRPRRTANRKEESMSTLSHLEIIGLDVSCDWLDLHCLSDGRQLRLRNTDEGHSELAKIAGDREALVCFEATGGHEWRLWASLEAAGIDARQLAPAQVKAFGKSRGTSAKTDRIDAELIARFMAFRPEAGRRLPSGKLRDLRALSAKRRQLVEMRKRRTGTGRRQRRVWEAWSIQALNSKPGKSANKDCPPLSMLAAPPRIQRRPFTNKPPTSGRVGRMWSIQAPNAKPECSANKDCPQAFHALRAAANEKQPNEPKRPKSGTPSGFIIGSGRIGPGAALKMQNPHEPSTSRSRRDSTRILTTSRYSCWRRLPCCKN